MKYDHLGDRMKGYYEDRYRISLTRRTPVIIRVDGKAFSTFTKGLKKPWDYVVTEAMNETAIALCEEIMGCKLAYVQSDEISLLLTDYDTVDMDAWFDYNLQKVVSVAASIATMVFNREFSTLSDPEVISDLKGFTSDPNIIEKISAADVYDQKLDIAMFDARAFNIPMSEVCNYFIWRQKDAIRNSVEALGREVFSQSELYKKKVPDVIEMLKTRGVDWEDLPLTYQRGCCVKRRPDETDTRGKWQVDDNIPLFTEDRQYINGLVWMSNTTKSDE